MNADPRITRTEAEETLLRQIAAASGAALPAVDREKAAGRFAEAGLPHRRIEEWHYTDLRAQLRHVPPLAEGRGDEAALKALIAADPLGPLDRARLVVVDGRFRLDLSDFDGLDGVSVSAIADRADGVGRLLPDAPGAPVDLNTALATDGVAITVPDGMLVSRPVEILHLVTAAEPVSAHTRHVVTVGKGASIRVIESYRGAAAAYLTNTVCELAAADEATILWAKLQDEAPAATHIANLFADLDGKVSLRHLVVTRGASLSRTEGLVRLKGGPDVRLSLAGTTMLSTRQHGDVSLTILHETPGSESRVLYKNVAGGEAHGIFQGKIIVHQDAQKTDGKMMSQSLLLSEEASFSTKPELEIYADDVQCGHGATSGEIDEDLLFYFLSRGIPRDEAENLLILAFLSEAVETLGDEAMSEAIQPVVQDWLDRRSSSAG